MNGLLDAVIRGSIRHRHLVLLCAGAVTLAGLWLTQSARLDALPGFTPPIVGLQAEAPGMGSIEVEQRVTAPLEQALLGTPGVARVRSTSSPGLSVMQLTFDDDVDIYRARQLVGERVALAREGIPRVLPPPQLLPISAPVGALLKFCITGAPGDPGAIQNVWQFAQWKLRPRLRAIEGVSRVIVHGGSTSRLEVRPDPTAMVARRLTLSDLAHTLDSAQGRAPLGFVNRGEAREPLRTNALWSFRDLYPIRSAVIEMNGAVPVRVADVAEVRAGAAPPVGAALCDGVSGIYIQVDKLPWADTLGVTRAVETALARLDTFLPPGTRRHSPVFRQADFVRTSLAAVGRAMGIGALLVVLVLIAFLRSWRLAAISLTAIPLSVLAAATVLLLRGVTINGMILGGLAIAVGEVVDDAIVDVENIWRRLRENARVAAPRPALAVIRDASAEVRGAVVYATLIVVAVLLPVIALGGLAGRIFAPLAETYALAMLASLAVALTVTPALCAVLLPRGVAAQTPEPVLTQRLRRAYETVLAFAAHRPHTIVATALALSAIAVLTLPFLTGGFLPEFHAGVLIAEVSAWPGTSLEETTRLTARLDGQLRGPGGLPHVAARVGRASLDEDAAPVHRAEMNLVLPPDAGDPDEYVARIAGRMAHVPGVRFTVEGFLAERINELLSGERSPVAVKLFGSDLAQLRRTARRVAAAMVTFPEVLSVRADALVDVPTRDLRIDAAGLGITGLKRSDIARAVAAWRQGLDVAQVKAPGGFSVPLSIAGAAGPVQPLRLDDFPVFTARGSTLPLSAVVHIRTGSEPALIRHENGRRIVTVTARAASHDLPAVDLHLHELLAGALKPPAGITWALAGQAAARRRSSRRLITVGSAVLAAIFVFLWLAFDSVLDAAVVLGGLPLGVVGGVAAALLLPEGLSMAGMIGFVTLFGIISRNGIMLVTHKNHLLAAHPERPVADLIHQAACERLIPILMTAGSALLALLPLALSVESAGSELEAPMAVIVCGGLATSTLLNLLVVPAFYLWHAQRGRPEKNG